MDVHVGQVKRFCNKRHIIASRCFLKSFDDSMPLGQELCERMVKRSEGFENRALKVAWGVLTHDLWVLAEKLRDQRRIRDEKLRQVA
jgi:hypothetical protein